ncbi:hypothetical protein ACFRQM_33485 [Streptomyces sp. NPDC056831]|uniref:hypothetical protein n=1 Tax=Streptomyces sp. NPDC056831 TaxID=3345954 RepID=UPI00368FD8AA
MSESKVPRWKMAVPASAAVYPVSPAAELVLLPRLGGLPMAARDAVTALAFSTAMTCLTLPALTGVLHD